MVRDELGFPLGTQLGQLVADFTRGPESLDGVEEVVRVAVLVEAVRGVLARLAFERADVATEIQVALLARLHGVAAHGAHELFEPRVLNALPDLQVEVGAIQLLGETGFDFDFVRVFGALAETVGLHTRPADDAGEAVEVRGAGADAERLGGHRHRDVGGEHEGEDGSEEFGFHGWVEDEGNGSLVR